MGCERSKKPGGVGRPLRRDGRGTHRGVWVAAACCLALVLACTAALPGVATASQTVAGSRLSTAALARECDPALRAEEPIDAFPFCSGYLLGLIDGTVIARRDGAFPHFCPPEDGLTVEQLLPLFLGWVKDHPGAATAPARRTLRQALQAVYPCTPR